MLCLKIACGDTVGGNHEVLDERTCAILFFTPQLYDAAIVNDGSCFDRLEVQSSLLMPPLLPPAGHTVLDTDLFRQPFNSIHALRHRADTLEPRAHTVVSQLGTVSYEGSFYF